jgi:hypothetical protein
MTFPLRTCNAGIAHRIQQWGDIGTIQIGHIVRYIEQMTLTIKHCDEFIWACWWHLSCPGT